MQRKQHRGPSRVACSAPSTGERHGSILMEISSDETSNGSVVADVDDNAISGGGVQDVYGEDRATEDQFVTPWSVSIAR